MALHALQRAGMASMLPWHMCRRLAAPGRCPPARLVGGQRSTASPQEDHAIVATLAKHVAPRRLAKLLHVLRHRVADTVIVTENMHDPSNVSALCRTADALGVQHVHVVQRWGGAFVPAHGVDKGTMKWLTIRQYTHVEDCVSELRRGGYQLYAATLGDDAVALPVAVAASLRASAATCTGAQARPAAAAPFRPRVALVFGNEHRGMSRMLQALADVKFFIPQAGFVQSLNVSVACALATSAFLHRTPDFAHWLAAAHAGAAPAHLSPQQAVRQLFVEQEVRVHASAPPLETATAVPTAVLEPLSPDARAAVLARWLLSDVTNAERLLEAAGVRPPDL